jgi:hypothetical protein
MVAVLPGKIIDQFEAAKQQLITASATWQLMEQLFARSQLSYEFLRRTGSGFPLLRDSMVADVPPLPGKMSPLLFANPGA